MRQHLPCNKNLRGTANDVVLRISISPQRVLLVHNLRLDKSKYKRIQRDHPENLVLYLNSEDGITVEAMLNDGCEEVISIVYQAITKDRELRCRNAKTASKKP